jgi:hypothetical protein
MIDFHSDPFQLALVPEDKIIPFKKYWDEDYLEETEDEYFRFPAPESYMASQGESVYLLKGFDELYKAKGKTKLL